jgi:predicted transcriptional regulator
MKAMPQEIEVWYILPAIRRELALALHKQFRQNEIADMLGVTEAAVSQYLKSKRASSVKFDAQTRKSIHESAKKISTNRNSFEKEMQRICRLIKKEMVLCKIHRQHDNCVPEDCKICQR